MQELTRNKRGLESDKLLLDVINDYPGLSQYELTKKLGWQSGRVDGVTRRLLNQKRIQIKSIERNGRIVNLVYPKDNKPSNIIEVPANLLHVENPTWLDSAFVYALDSTTIGIAGNKMPEWNEVSCFIEKIPIKKQGEKIVLQIPEKFSRFYTMRKDTRPELVQRVGIRARETNNIIERLHGTLKDRTKPMRGLKSYESTKLLLEGWSVHYNCVRPHQSLGNKTPAQAARMEIPSNWKGLIDEATKHEATILFNVLKAMVQTDNKQAIEVRSK